MKLTREEFDIKYEKNELTNTDLFDTIFYLFDREKELEALENRSCESCKYNQGGYCELYESDFINLVYLPYVEEKFCCNKWESK